MRFIQSEAVNEVDAGRRWSTRREREREREKFIDNQIDD